MPQKTGMMHRDARDDPLPNGAVNIPLMRGGDKALLTKQYTESA